MITYDPFWKTLKDRGLTTYTLIEKLGFSSHTIHRLRHNGGTSTSLIDVLCKLLNCKVEDILKYVPDDQIESPEHPTNYQKK